jgi:hypothetical protein
MIPQAFRQKCGPLVKGPLVHARFHSKGPRSFCRPFNESKAMSDPKKQHYVPQFYLREFIDPNTPQGQEPYVWVFSKDGKKKQRRAPKNVLWETDLYTFNVEGEKHYELEKALSQIECDFADAIRKKIKPRLPLTVEEHRSLCLFVATMLQRTVRQKDNQENFYDQLVAQVERLETRPGSIRSTSAKLRAAKKDVHKAGILGMLSEIPDLLGRMNLAFLCPDRTAARFITSDDPVTLFNPDLQWQRLYGPGLAQKGVELTMPLAPDIALCMTWSNLRGYINIPGWRVEELNRFTRGHCYEHFISHSPKKKFIWFSRIPLYSPSFMLMFLRRSVETQMRKLRATK